MRIDFTLIIIIILVSLLGKFIFITFNEGLWWDEAVYLGLGKGLAQGYYSLDPNLSVESFRPPIFPFFIALFSNSIFLARTLVVVISILSVISVYFLAKELFNDKETALLTSLILSANSFFIFFTTKVLSEALFTSLFSPSLLFFVKWVKEKVYKYLFLAGIFAGFVFLTRYLGWIVILSYILYFLYKLIKKNDSVKSFCLFLTGILIPLLPWFLLSCHYYANPLGAFLTNFLIYSHEETSPMLSFFPYLFEVFGLAVIFICFGIYFFVKGSRNYEVYGLVLLLFFLPLLVFLLLSHKEPRYLLSFLPVYVVIAAYGVNNRYFKSDVKATVSLIVVIFCLISIVKGFQLSWNDRFAAHSLEQACVYLKDITNQNETIISQSYPYVYYLSQRKTITLCGEPKAERDYLECVRDLLDHKYTSENVSFLLKKYQAKYIILYKFEPSNPSYISHELSINPNFKVKKTFEQWNDVNATVVYEWVGENKL